MKLKSAALVFLTLGFAAGILFTGITLNLSAGRMMLVEIKSPYDHEKTVEKIVEGIAAQPGWRVVATIDQRKACLDGGGGDIGKFTIVKYCNGRFAGEMLSDDERKRFGAMMPKAFAVYEKREGGVYVSTVNGAAMGKLFGGETEGIMERVSLEVEAMLRFLNFKFSIF